MRSQYAVEMQSEALPQVSDKDQSTLRFQQITPSQIRADLNTNPQSNKRQPSRPQRGRAGKDRDENKKKKECKTKKKISAQRKMPKTETKQSAERTKTKQRQRGIKLE